jgi:golgin subfamily B member 1
MTCTLLPDPPPARLATWLIWRLTALGANERAKMGPRLLAPLLASLGTETERARRSAIADCLVRVHDGVPVPGVLFEAAGTAKLHGDVELERRILERLMQDELVPALKARVLERLGDVLEETGERSAASRQWKAAAVLASQARHLYERALEAQPDDADAAAQLVDLYSAAGEWERIPEVFAVVHRASETRGCELLLRLEGAAIEARAHGIFVAMADEVLALRAPTQRLTHDLYRARTRALAADPATHAMAAAAYRSLIETFGSDDDARAFEQFLEGYTGNPHVERRFLFSFRQDHSTEAMLSWACAEEAHGAFDEAISVYGRLLAVAENDDRITPLLKALHLLLERDRIDEAVGVLAELLGIAPSILRAHEIAHGLLADERRDIVIDGLERHADEAGGDRAGRIFGFLIGARAETATLPIRRRRWYARMFELCSDDLPLSFVREAVLEAPDETAFWNVLDRKGERDLVEVVRTYAEAITTRPLDPSIAQELGRRMLAREVEASMPDLPVVVDALEKILDLAPNTKWALDRVTLMLGARGDWDALFSRYDRAVENAVDEAERVALFEEAGVAARDLADDPARAIRYFERVRAARPGAASIGLALERLYERSGRIADLVALLAERAGTADGTVRREIQRRIVTLWLDASAIDQAAHALESMLEDGATTESVIDLLEHVAVHPEHDRARNRLRAHYEAVRRFDDLVRIGKCALRLASERQRRDCIRQLVRIRVAVAEGAFARAATLLAADVAEDPSIQEAAYRAFLGQALFSWRRATTDDQWGDAADGVRRAIDALTSEGDRARAAQLFERAARLPFDRAEQRRFRHRAAILAHELGDDRRAIRLLGEVFHDDCDDDLARAELDRFVALLEKEQRWGKLASLWEARAAKATEASSERAAIERAGAFWEREGDARRAIAIYPRGAALGSVLCYERIATLYAAQGRHADAVQAREWLYEHASDEELGTRAIDLAEALTALNEGPRARTCLERALCLSPRTDVRARLIELYRQDQEWAPLVELLEAAAASEPGATHWSCEAASVRATHLGDIEGAVHLLEAARVGDPGSAAVRPLLATYLSQLGEWGRASEVLAEHLASVSERRPAVTATLRFDLARALLRLNRSAEALEELRVAAKILPTHTGILRELARLALSAGDLDTAERAYRAVLLANKRGDDAGSRIPIYLDLSAIALRREDRSRATRLLESALDVAIEEGQDPIAIEAALRDAGRYDLAARALEVRVDRASGETARLQALDELVLCWSEHLGRDPELGKRIRTRAEAALHALSQATRNKLRVIVARVVLDDPSQRDVAIRALESAIADDPSDENALEVLTVAFEQDGNDDGLARILTLRSSLIERHHPEHTSMRLRLARALEAVGRAAEAQAVYESLLDPEPSDPVMVRTLIEKLEILRSGRLADALEIACRLEPSPLLVSRLVDLRSAEQDEAALVRALELAVATQPEPVLVEILVTIYEGRADAAAVARVLAAARDCVIGDDGLLGRLVSAHRSLGIVSASLPFLDAALERRPDAGEMRLLRAQTRIAVALDDAALDDVIALGAPLDLLTTLVERNPANARACLLLADTLDASGRIEEAAALVDRLLAHDPDHEGALERAAGLAMRRGLLQEAANVYERLFAVHPESAAIMDRLAEVYERTRDFRRLATLLVTRAGNEANLVRRGAHLVRAATLTFDELGDAKEAARLTDLARAADESLDAALLGARIEISLERPAAAVTILEGAIARARGKRSVQLANVYLECAKAHLALDELDLAMDCLKTGFGLSVVQPELAMLLGLVAMDLGENAIAERALVAVATFASRGGSDASSSAACAHLASLAKARGDSAKARHWSAKAGSAPRSKEGAWSGIFA